MSTSSARTEGGSRRGALERCVGDVDTFVRSDFGHRPHLHDGGPYDDLLSFDDVDHALTGSGLRRPAVRLVRDGAVLDPATWTRRARTGAVTLDDVVDPARVLDLYAEGATVVLQSLHRWWPAVTEFCRALEAGLDHAVQANAYLTGPGAVGLAPHHDTHDVFVLQLHGTKHWEVREPLLQAPLRRHRSDPATAGLQPLLFETELRPGTCMYLPRGTIHSARAQHGPSLHLTIGVLATTAADVVRRVARLAGDVPALRRDLPAGWAHDPAMAERVVKEILGELAGFVTGLDAGALAHEMADVATGSRQPSQRGRLVDLARVDEIDDDTIVTRRDLATIARVTPTTEGSTRSDDGHVELRTGDRRISLPATTSVAIDRLLDGRRHAVADLADLADAPSRRILVRRLVREGLLRIVTPTHSYGQRGTDDG